MSADGQTEARAGAWSSLLSLFASSSTLVCCALPALLVALGAGAALSSLVSAVPQLVWLSERKEILFSVVAVVLVAAGVLQWRNRHAPCPTDPRLRSVCLRTRRVSATLYAISVGVFVVGGFFAFALPVLMASSNLGESRPQILGTRHSACPGFGGPCRGEAG